MQLTKTLISSQTAIGFVVYHPQNTHQTLLQSESATVKPSWQQVWGTLCQNIGSARVHYKP